MSGTATEVPLRPRPARYDPPVTTPPVDPPLATYEDLRYRDVFWPQRGYEDGSDRLALRSLLPHSGGELLDVGAGFGRLVDEYAGFRHIVLLDASEVHVAAARERFAGEPRVEIVTGDAIHLPFADGRFDAVVCVRLIHHFEDGGPLIAELARVLRPGGRLVLEQANKRNLKAVLRHVLLRSADSPFAAGPHRYRELHFDHAPRDVRRWLAAAGLTVVATRTASLFRLPVVSRHLPARILLGLERPLQVVLAPITPGPSVFVGATKGG